MGTNINDIFVLHITNMPKSYTFAATELHSQEIVLSPLLNFDDLQNKKL